MEREAVVVVGAGVAGASAAIEAARLGLSVTLVDEHPLDLATMAMDAPYFFGPRLLPTLGDRGLMLERVVEGSELLARADEAGVKVALATCAWGSFRPGPNSRHLERPCLGLADGERSWLVEYEHLVLAPGARDLVLSFPGWERAGVMGASAALALMTRYRALAGRDMVILGSGNLGLEVARAALAHGLRVAAVVDVAADVRGRAELWAPLAAQGVPFVGSHVVQEVLGDKEVRAVRLVRLDGNLEPVPGGERAVTCYTVCLAVGLVPNVELAALTGCRLGYRPEQGGWVPERTGELESSVAGVYVVGDGAGVHEDAVVTPGLAADEGRRAAIAVAEARGALPADRARALRRDLATAGPPAPGAGREADADQWQRALVATGGMDVVACQCEGVTRQELVDVSPPRYLAGSPKREWEPKLATILEAGGANPDLLKRLTRAGMGHCQGRRCREQVAWLLARAAGGDVADVPLASYRPPVRPLSMRVLGAADEAEAVRAEWASWFYPRLRIHHA
jgi:thioredoxin reductase